MTALTAAGLGRTFGEGELAIHALRDIDLAVPEGQFVVLLGPSGSGKTTLLNVVGAIDEPTVGSLVVDGVDLGALDDAGRTGFRRDHAGFVFQFFNLVPSLTALENIQLICELTDRGDAADAAQALREVGLEHRRDAFPSSLSGGEQQRVAIARAVAKRPRILLADEPTGSLDLVTGRHVLDLLRRLNRQQGLTVLLVTHNGAIARMADRVLRLRDGQLVSDESVAAPAEAEDLEW